MTLKRCIDIAFSTLCGVASGGATMALSDKSAIMAIIVAAIFAASVAHWIAEEPQ